MRHNWFNGRIRRILQRMEVLQRNFHFRSHPLIFFRGTYQRNTCEFSFVYFIYIGLWEYLILHIYFPHRTS